MADRVIEPLPRRPEPGAKSPSLLPPAANGEPRAAGGRAPFTVPPPSRGSDRRSFLALLEPLPSDYYLG